jgi:predicted nuclease of restriction endonuclease-like (RecB) superfamily
MEMKKAASYILEIKEILVKARQKAYSAVNTAMVEAYWLVGKRIVEEEQNGNNRANYGEEILKSLSKELSQEFGKGFSTTNIKNIRKFYLVFSKSKKGQTLSDLSETSIWQAVSAKLTWSHFERLMRVENEEARKYYLKEAADQNWSVRTLDRNISTLYYQRLIASQKKEIINKEMEEKTKDFKPNPDDFIKNPAVLDFLNLPKSNAYTEKELEQALIDNLQQFLLELGKGFAFVTRQKHIRTETADFFIDLVFYNYVLKCFVIVEIKTHKLTHQDIGQLDMYVRMFDDLERPKGDNPTIGILLCTETDSTIVKYSVLRESQQLFASKYLPYLPTEKELVAEIEREKLFIKQQLGI